MSNFPSAPRKDLTSRRANYHTTGFSTEKKQNTQKKQNTTQSHERGGRVMLTLLVLSQRF